MVGLYTGSYIGGGGGGGGLYLEVYDICFPPFLSN